MKPRILLVVAVTFAMGYYPSAHSADVISEIRSLAKLYVGEALKVLDVTVTDDFEDAWKQDMILTLRKIQDRIPTVTIKLPFGSNYCAGSAHIAETHPHLDLIQLCHKFLALDRPQQAQALIHEMVHYLGDLQEIRSTKIDTTVAFIVEQEPLLSPTWETLRDTKYLEYLNKRFGKGEIVSPTKKLNIQEGPLNLLKQGKKIVEVPVFTEEQRYLAISSYGSCGIFAKVNVGSVDLEKNHLVTISKVSRLDSWRGKSYSFARITQIELNDEYIEKIVCISYSDLPLTFQRLLFVSDGGITFQ